MNKKIYICHTPYQVLITMIKKYNDTTPYDIIICDTIANYKEIIKKIEELNLFKKIYSYPEQLMREKFQELKIETKIFRTNEMINLFETNSNIKLSDYNDIYIYNDWTTIGAYLMDKKISYHLIEDGIDSFYYAKENFKNKESCFNPNLKYKIKHLIKKMLHRGYDFYGQSKYVIDIEVNNLAKIPIKSKKMFEKSKKDLYSSINQKQKNEIYNVFTNEVYKNKSHHKSCLILTQPLFKDDMVDSINTQIKIYKSIIDKYIDNYDIIIKPHPRDDYDYKKIYKDITIIDRLMPIEIMNFKDDVHFDLAITLKSSSIQSLKIVKDKKELGLEYIQKFI